MIGTPTQRQMPTAAFAVQPRAWTTFDEWGCEWATDINHAYRLAQAFGEQCTIWRVPHTGDAYAWANADAVH